MISYRNTAKEIADSGVDTAVLPFGSVEQHSSHLPIATDVILAEEIAKAVSERIDALLLPTIPIFIPCPRFPFVKYGNLLWLCNRLRLHCQKHFSYSF